VRAEFAVRYERPQEQVRRDLLVAADGIHSTVRSLLFPAEGPPRWNGS
jgi:2-polyprenyl-6-methoxyphenol hydroxylase-like FAD-dependent oxidoreductase